MSKKSLITAVSTAAMVATLGFAYAQSSDEGAYPNANINGSVNNSEPKHWARDSVIDNNPYDTAAPTAAGPSSALPADTTAPPADSSMTPADSAATSSTATPPAVDATSPWAADTSSTPPAATASPSTSAPNTVDSVNQTNSSLSTNTAPSETHIDLNSPNDPIYNMGRSNDSERAPRPDRN
jgi:hypothetical protein